MSERQDSYDNGIGDTQINVFQPPAQPDNRRTPEDVGRLHQRTAER
ncbi:hypothetical protein [Pseudomonas pohangensis]|nr:hypothetical protein [Pseudomonas pohangensis]